MSSAMSGGGTAGGNMSPRPALSSSRGRVLLPTLVVLVAVLLLLWRFADFYTDWLWFRSVNYSSVMRTELLTKALLFFVFGGLLAGVVASNFIVAYRTRPVYALISPEQQSLERYRSSIAPYRRWLAIGPALALGLLAGASAAGNWRTYLLWRNGTDFGQTDPQFGLDISFYAFDLPWWRFLISFVFTALILSLMVAAATHYLYGGLRLQGTGERTTPAARVHLSVLLGLFVLAKAVAYWLDRYSLATADSTIRDNQPFTGLKYTDVNAVLGAKYALAVIAAICALLFFSGVIRRTWLLPGIGAGLLLVSAIVVGAVLPGLVQWVQVRPSEAQREEPYIARNIEATRQAYDIADAQVEDFDPVTTKATRAQVQQAADLSGVRLLDPAVVSPSFRRDQQVKQYYRFPSALDIGRYQIDGKMTDVVLGARELDLNQPQAQLQRNWINDHLVYTHGYGLVAARSDAVQPDGKPAFVEGEGIQDKALGPYEPRIYYGEFSPDYSIVGGPAGDERELDYFDPNSQGQLNTTYAGAGGVPVGSFFRQMLYAVKYQEEKILLSEGVNPQSKLLDIRKPRERVAKIAPWLTLDGDPYPAVIDGRVQWIVDGYTTSAGYPYALHTSLDTATSDSLSTTGSVTRQPGQQINYIRNSVKATVDAFDGTVQLYAWDEEDPVLKAWRSAFPDVVKDRGAMSEQLLQRVRYPQDLFKIQRTLLGNYHQTDPGQFYSGSDFWEVPEDPSVPQNDRANVRQPAYYLPVQLPGEQQPQFSLTTAFVPRSRETPLTAFAAVGSDPNDDYGRIRVLRMKNTLAPGPEQFVTAYENNGEVLQSLSLLRVNRAVRIGNVLTLPVGNSLLYVAPVYVQESNSSDPYPLLQKVAVSFGGNQIGFRDNLPDAIAALGESIGNQPGAPPPTPGATPTPSPSPTGSATPSPSGPPPAADPAALAKALADAQAAIRDGDAALRDGPDFAAFDQAQDRLRAALDRAAKAQGPTGSAAPTPQPGTPPAAPGG